MKNRLPAWEACLNLELKDLPILLLDGHTHKFIFDLIFEDSGTVIDSLIPNEKKRLKELREVPEYHYHRGHHKIYKVMKVPGTSDSLHIHYLTTPYVSTISSILSLREAQAAKDLPWRTLPRDKVLLTDGLKMSKIATRIALKFATYRKVRDSRKQQVQVQMSGPSNKFLVS